MENGTDQMEEMLLSCSTWASWDFQPSPWSAGALLVNCLDHDRSPFVGYAAPGVSLRGEQGFETAFWRFGCWPSSADFLLRHEPEWVRVLEFDQVYGEIPEDFTGWATDATAAHIERLRAISGQSPSSSAAAEFADLLHAELEMTLPGSLERVNDEFGEELLGSAMAPRSRLHRRLGLDLDRRHMLEIALNIVALALLYFAYTLVREPWASRGAQVGFGKALSLPIGDFGVWLYGLAHVMVPVAFLTWAYFRRPRSFAYVRNTSVFAGGLAVLAYVVYSPKPVYAASPASVPSGALATMPALHLVLALTLGYFGVTLCRSNLVRLFWAAYPILVAAVLVGTGTRDPQLTMVTALVLLGLSMALARLAASRVPALRAVSDEANVSIPSSVP